MNRSAIFKLNLNTLFSTHIFICSRLEKKMKRGRKRENMFTNSLGVCWFCFCCCWHLYLKFCCFSSPVSYILFIRISVRFAWRCTTNYIKLVELDYLTLCIRRSKTFEKFLFFLLWKWIDLQLYYIEVADVIIWTI